MPKNAEHITLTISKDKSSARYTGVMGGLLMQGVLGDGNLATSQPTVAAMQLERHRNDLEE